MEKLVGREKQLKEHKIINVDMDTKHKLDMIKAELGYRSLKLTISHLIDVYEKTINIDA